MPTFNELRNSLPQIFDEMIAALTTGNLEKSADVRNAAHNHAVERREIAFNLREVLIEFEILRRIVLQEATDELTRPLRLQETVAINAGIDFVLRRCVLEFTEQQAKEVASAAEAQAKHLSFLSHDLRGSLNGILLMIEVLKRELQQHESFSGIGLRIWT